MPIQHRDIADGEIHETKGVTTAPLNSFLKAGPGNVGVWAFDEDFIDLDIATLATATSYNLIMPHSGTFLKLYSVIDGAIGTADTTLTLKINGTNVTNGVITIPFSGSAAGQINSAFPTALNTATQGQLVTLTCNGVSSGTVRCHVSLVFLRTS